jgi:L-lactate dehydrogenase complex protein LldG
MSRDVILGRIRAALDPRESEASRRRAAWDRLAVTEEPPSLTRTRLPPAGLVALFKAHLGTLGADVVEVATPAAIPAAIADYLEARRQPLRVRIGSDPLFAGLPWREVSSLTVDRGCAQDSDTAGLSRAVAGVAETGTLLLASGAYNPVTLAFVPDLHLVALRASAIVASYEQAVELVQAETGSTALLPRTLNFITGASRTGDIGGRIVMGAHGPRRLAVFLLGDS